MRLKLKFVVLLAVIMTFIVIVLGAYTRLKDAGLGCPDWPGCYGKLLAPADDYKAWIEMIHRYVASSLGFLIVIITIWTIKLYKQKPKLWIFSSLLLALVIFQGLLGMWTVTMRLYPIVVMGHLLGGFAIFALTWLLYLNLSQTKEFTQANISLKILSCIALIVLIGQIFLGGWTSANYAALVCADLLTCQGHLWPQMDWQNAFNLTATGIFDSPGVPLENTARVTIQMAHRLGALVTSFSLSILAYKLITSRSDSLRHKGIVLVLLLTTQLCLGALNVLARLPLTISLLHNAIAALLLLLSVTIIFEIYAKPRIIK